MCPSFLFRDADHIHRYEGLPFLAVNAAGGEYVLTPIFFNSFGVKTFHLRDLYGCLSDDDCFVEFISDVPWGEFGRYVLRGADSSKIPLRSDDYLAP